MRISFGIFNSCGDTKVIFTLNNPKAYEREWTVRPYFRSPTRATFKFSICPNSFFIVYKSSKVCVGCCPAPSPALITGTSTISDIKRDTPSSSCLIIKASEYDSNIFAVSAIDSPFIIELDAALSIPIHDPPNLFIAVSKDSFVLVEGSKNISPITFPLSEFDIFWDFATFSNLAAFSNI